MITDPPRDVFLKWFQDLFKCEYDEENDAYRIVHGAYKAGYKAGYEDAVNVYPFPH